MSFPTPTSQHTPALRRILAQTSAAFLADLLALGADTSVVLELGCGLGRLTEQLLPLVRRMIAVDRSASAVARLQQRADQQGLCTDELWVLPWSAFTGSADQQPTTETSKPAQPTITLPQCDAAVSALVYHHLSDAVAMTRWQAKQVKPHGYVATIDVQRDATTERLAAATNVSSSCWHKALCPSDVVNAFNAAGLCAVRWRTAFAIHSTELTVIQGSPPYDAPCGTWISYFVVWGSVP
jgi:SAM-dependent methyltransferase